MRNLLVRSIANPAFGGILLILSTIFSLLTVNINSGKIYYSIIYFPSQFFENTHFLTLYNIVNEVLMTIFFLSVGLEVKYEFLNGKLNKKNDVLFCTLAAIGGMIFPAILYSLINIKSPEFQIGWAIPTATDIAFSIGILTLLGDKISKSLKIFIMMLGIIDDVGAIFIIAIFYSYKINIFALFISAFIIGIIIIMNISQVNYYIPYLFFGIILWIAIFLSGIHVTITGVIVGTLIPLFSNKKKDLSKSFLLIKKNIQPYITYFILPAFAFVNSNISIKLFNMSCLTSSITLGIIFGLVVGKPLGIVLFTFISKKLNFVNFPKFFSLKEIFYISTLCGIGFTMSIFISNLAFEKMGKEIIFLSKIGIFSGSLLSAIIGFCLLRQGKFK